MGERGIDACFEALEKGLREAAEHLASAREAERAGDCGTAAKALMEVYMTAGSAGKTARNLSRPLAAEAIDPRPSATCERCDPPCDRWEQCDTCTRQMAHDYVHWNGAFYQCEHCAIAEASADLAYRQAELLR